MVVCGCKTNPLLHCAKEECQFNDYRDLHLSRLKNNHRHWLCYHHHILLQHPLFHHHTSLNIGCHYNTFSIMKCMQQMMTPPPRWGMVC